MKKVISIIVLLVVLFYHIFPQALPLLGFSFVFTSGGLGLFLYLYNGRPYSEIITIVFFYLLFGAACLLTGYINNSSDPYFINSTKSQVAWLFSAYFVIYLFFAVNPKGNFADFLFYVMLAITIQGVITIAMYMNPAVNSFFSSIQMTDWLAGYKRDETEGERLLGYGTAFFGAGIVYGMGLIITVYVLVRKKMNIIMQILVSAIYVFIFFVGLFSARTTMVGFFASIALLLFSFFLDKRTLKGQVVKFSSFVVVFGIIGYTLSYIYFSDFADWAFEAFINYQETGELRTHSSDGIEDMMFFPESNQLQVWLVGVGSMRFFGSDVGYSRLIWYVGLIGTFTFFLFQFVLAWLCLTKDKTVNVMMLLFMIYVLALNVKGLAEVNVFMYLFVFYFLHYKYYIYTPQMYRLGKFNSTKLRYAVQGSSPGRRI